MDNDIRVAQKMAAHAEFRGPRNLVDGPSIAREKAAIESVTQDLGNALESLHDTISRLQTRLQPVTTPVPTSETEPGVDLAVYGSSEMFYTLKSRLELAIAARTRLQTTLDLLEI